MTEEEGTSRVDKLLDFASARDVAERLIRRQDLRLCISWMCVSCAADDESRESRNTRRRNDGQPVRTYREEMHGNLGFFASWLPADPVDVGDIGVLEGGRFRASEPSPSSASRAMSR